MTIDYRLAGCTPPPACYQDLQCAIRWVHAHADEYQLDPERIFLIGMSAGGHLVSLVATLGDGPFARTGGWEKESADIRGVISLSAPYELEQLSWGNLWKPAAGDALEARRLASPIRHISTKTRPILILHSDNDGSVPLQQAKDMAAALEKAKAPHRISIYKNQGHMRVTPDVIKETRAFIEEISKSTAEPPKNRGAAAAKQTRPDHFPHRIWAACDFEGQTPDYAWFGPAETKNIPVYPGNTTALGVKEKPYAKFSALEHTKLRFRYFLSGASAMTAQLFDVTDGDNRHIPMKGLKEGTWEWAILDFSNDAKRNDGSETSFAAGHKVDDLFFLVRPESDQEVQLYVDEVTLFDAGKAGK